jgi:hypothetical protein
MTIMTDLPPNNCPGCDRNLNATTGDGGPSPGDYSICLYCATVLRFNEDMTVRAVPDKEIPYSVMRMRDNLIIYRRRRKAMLN